MSAFLLESRWRVEVYAGPRHFLPDRWRNPDAPMAASIALQTFSRHAAGLRTHPDERPRRNSTRRSAAARQEAVIWAFMT
jgi:hypothetical protein